MCYCVPNKQKPSKIRSRKCNNSVCTTQLPTNWLYNSLPKYLRDIESVIIEKLKFKLDKFLELIPYPPKMPYYVTVARTNSILDQLSHIRAQGFYQCVGVPDSALEQA